jgi:hypothetical protein
MNFNYEERWCIHDYRIMKHKNVYIYQTFTKNLALSLPPIRNKMHVSNDIAMTITPRNIYMSMRAAAPDSLHT